MEPDTTTFLLVTERVADQVVVAEATPDLEEQEPLTKATPEVTPPDSREAAEAAEEVWAHLEHPAAEAQCLEDQASARQSLDHPSPER